MTLSQLDLEDVEALHLGPSFLTADTIGPLLEQCDGALFTLPSASCLSPDLLLEDRGLDWTLPWAQDSVLLDECPQIEDDGLVVMDWVSERLDLSELDLDSLLDSSDDCPESPDLPGPPLSPQNLPGPPLSPEGSSSELDVLPTVSLEEVPEASIKTEPVSPAPSPEGPAEGGVSQTTIKSPESDSDSDSGIDSSPSHSPPHSPTSSRATPYSRPGPDHKKGPVVKGPYRSVEKRQKKMEQNKSAATRYRQKKREEQEHLSAECLLLERRNQELSERAQAISKEISYLKDLMEEVRRHHQNKSRSAAP